MMFPLSTRQREVLAVIKDLTEKHDGIPPTTREIAAVLGISQGAVIQNIKRITQRGYIRRLPHTPRTLVICKEREGEAA